MPAKKSSRKRTTAKKSTSRKSAAKRSPAKKAVAKKTAAKRSPSRKKAGSRKKASSTKKNPIAKMVKNPKRTARTAVKIARKTADVTHDVGEKIVGASDLVTTALDAVDTLVSGSKRRSRRTKNSKKS